MRYQVPQFTDIEDKVIGPFTLKQFLIYIGGVFILLPLFLAFDISLFITVAVPIAGITVLFAHVRPNGKSLFVVIGNALAFFMRGQLFIWRRTEQNKPMRISGPEYAGFATAASRVPLTAGLSMRAQELETHGNVTKEDAEDPMVPGTE